MTSRARSCAELLHVSRLCSVDQLILCCKTTKGVVEERVKHNAEEVYVWR